MGSARFESIHDYIGRGCDLGVRCSSCRRVVVFDAEEVRSYLAARQALTGRFERMPSVVCRCGCREVRFHPVIRSLRPDPLPPRRPVLQPIYARER